MNIGNGYQFGLSKHSNDKKLTSSIESPPQSYRVIQKIAYYPQKGSFVKNRKRKSKMFKMLGYFPFLKRDQEDLYFIENAIIPTKSSQSFFIHFGWQHFNGSSF